MAKIGTWCLMFAVGAAFAFAQESGSKKADSSKPAKISAQELDKLLKKGEVYFLDVREPKEIQELGSIKGYVNIPMGELEKRLAEIPKDKLIVTA